jgi:hypothetical protein
MTHSARWWIALVALLGAAGCSSPLSQVLLPDSTPDVKLASVRLDPPTPDSYAYMARWVGLSTGRKIDHYLVAIDPVSVDAVDARWVRTTATQQVLTFPSGEKTKATRRSHVFVVRAVDDRGAMSEPKYFTFAEGNQPPVVQIVQPPPSSQFIPSVPPEGVRITWTGFDPDGQTTTHPVRYVFRLFGQHNPDRPEIPDYISFALLYPDSVRAFYAPEFHGWQSVPGETTGTRYQNLNPGSTYLFIVTGFDEAGDYDPVFSASKNMLQMSVVFPNTSGPILTMFNQFFNYTYPDGAYIVDPSRTVRLEIPADVPVTICWYATPAAGATIDCYRWVMDPRDLFSPLIRKSDSMWFYWTRCSIDNTCATIGPFRTNGEEHLLYIEAKDSSGLKSLGIVLLRVVRSTFEKDLLFVDDTRLRVDRASGTPGQVLPPVGQWPTAAELDTFLYARGGFPWKSYPAGTISPPGIFIGYNFDTVGTRGLSADGRVPLSFLSQYRHVVWYTDELGATYTGPPTDRGSPITSLRLMSGPGQDNSLATYVGLGGKLWLCGGGAAYATLIPWNKAGTPPNEYNDLEPNPELRPGRFMYDLVHWRDAIHMNVANNARKFGTTSFGTGSNRPGRHWPPNPPPPTPPSPPDYSALPAILNPKTVLTDPPPPLRFADAYCLREDYMAEFIPVTPGVETYIREDYNDDPNVVDEYSTLDTLYISQGLVAIPNSPVMTYYHGRENAPLVFSGFNIWYWRRTQCIALADWVLQNVWGLQREPVSREPSAAVSAIARRSGAAPANR